MERRANLKAFESVEKLMRELGFLENNPFTGQRFVHGDGSRRLNFSVGRKSTRFKCSLDWLGRVAIARCSVERVQPGRVYFGSS